MPARQRDERPHIIEEIRKKNYYLNLVILCIVALLCLVIYVYLRHPVSHLTNMLPDLSISVAVASVFLVSLGGLYLALALSRQTLRIIEDYRARLERILGITKELREEIHGDVLLEKIMSAAVSLTGAEAGSLLLIEDGDLVFRLAHGEKASALPGTVVEKGKGIVGWVAETGEPLRVDNVSRDDRYNPELDSLTGFSTKAMLCVPLRTREGVLGVLAVLNKKGGPAFRQRDEELIEYLADQAAISIIKTKFVEDQRNYEIHLTEILLEAIDFQIPEKRGHSRRVARYSNLIAKQLNLPDEDRKRLYFASLLHDVGFLKIRADEGFAREDFMRHSSVGFEMIMPINFYAGIAPFILHHHERFDGHGYPKGLKGEEIPLEARIIAVAEAFDTMVSTTSYKVPVSFTDAIEELQRTAGAQFDPEIVRIFAETVTPEHTR